MTRRLSSTLYTGFINKELTANYVYTFEDSGKFQTVVEAQSGKIIIRPTYNIIISEGFNKACIFIPSSRYHHFAQLLANTVKTISENLYDIFPNIGKIEFEVDTLTLQRYQTEKAMSTGGFTMVPCVYADATDTCFPGIRITGINSSTIIMPLEDAIPLSHMFSTFDPNVYGLCMLKMLGKID